jgi:hypothetical protein
MGCTRAESKGGATYFDRHMEDETITFYCNPCEQIPFLM